METKKLIKILLKDMSELEELIASVKASKQFKALEMEFMHTRAKGVLQLMQLIDSDEEYFQSEVFEKRSEEKEIEEIIVSGISPAEGSETQAPVAETVSGVKKEKELTEQKTIAPEEKKPAASASFSISVTEEKEEESDDEFVAPVYESQGEEADEDMLEEEVKSMDAVHRLGEMFTKGKSLNERSPEQNKLESKLSNLPVSNLQTAIGINDRFQYIRELFDGDNQKYLEAVKTLDSFDNLKDAVDYLRNNFKWKKNETSLKFVRLVKRRFPDE